MKKVHESDASGSTKPTVSQVKSTTTTKAAPRERARVYTSAPAQSICPECGRERPEQPCWLIEIITRGENEEGQIYRQDGAAMAHIKPMSRAAREEWTAGWVRASGISLHFHYVETFRAAAALPDGLITVAMTREEDHQLDVLGSYLGLAVDAAWHMIEVQTDRTAKLVYNYMDKAPERDRDAELALGTAAGIVGDNLMAKFKEYSEALWALRHRK